MPDPDKVNSMFSRIAAKYDLANRALSLGIDTLWRDRLVDEVWLRNPSHITDLATGSGDVAFELRKEFDPQIRIDGLDFCEPMLDEARKKQAKAGYQNMSFAVGDCLALPLPDASTDAVTISFGYRNLGDRHQGLLEMRRILRPSSGYLYILEFSQPLTIVRPFYYFYLKTLLPNIAGALTGDVSAYQYLSDSIEAFPPREGITEELRRAGFRDIKAIPMTCGMVALHIAKA
ncbi:bifunctional demethylmenaquinone methyltransferase/2-methoxy-6-polyprenyl-1,4-benzoquinol methylase UbiE [Pelagicoccus sp. NFK12]|uniref:Demethylmenaquinone methyltransferase n=1 Tax=Pelagicoccus enzymogenes TaxID=2773457 RepID=A0A927FB34_9BACT|nr:bifunctional demethylmenaquinone methyltransferase/2-methoxy-6-polyprenyl-1,4-benzoquinol methylase UbiE [Pelagicoccus enzymogenes]MBD5780183.1 bifunctional demethylmenaquinone methyltransferase/2-methoxy-6-polyprenyl-1,4-benzoquinol methylase UbiE [Pelagicoccus enzymogenes]MDQ8198554.1 bifunctional demethylmenaquinone methyltransferase/2-methoxy-6-polyprenyl-1,4-benzoquinol methylase UbiE [Pelagicoccus enzymogenes]